MLLGQSCRGALNPSVPGFQLRLLFNLASSWKYRSGLFVLFPARSRVIRTRGSGPAGSCPGRRKQLLEEIFSELRDNKQDKRYSKLSCFVRNLTTEPHWLNHRNKPKRFDSGLANLVTEIQNCQEGVQGFASVGFIRQEHDFESLCEEGHLDKALDVLLHLEQRGTVPSVRMYTCLLKGCAKRKALAQAKRAHAQFSKFGLESSKLQFLGECTVSTLVKCGGLEDALDVFNSLPYQTTFSWTALISGHSMLGEAKEALRMYQRMQEEGVQPNAYTFVSLLKACGRLRDLKEGKRIHAEAVKYSFGPHLYVRTCLVDMYGKCGSTVDALDAFNGLSQPDVVSWNAMLAAYAQQGEAEKSLWLYGRMQDEGVSPNARTFVSAVQACSILAEREEAAVSAGCSGEVKSLKTGRKIHADARRKGYDKDVFVGSTLISMYGKCGRLIDARNVFDGLSCRTVVAWNAMSGAYVEHGQAEEALQLYEQMGDNGVSPDDRTFVSALQACGMLAENKVTVGLSVVYLDKGRAIHADIQRKGYDSDVFVRSSLVSMYGNCGSLVDAQNVFEGMSQRDVVSWNAMIVAYAQQGQAGKALRLYEQMLEDGVSPTVRTCVSALQACGMLADEEEDVLVDGGRTKQRSLVLGRAIHADTLRRGYGSDVFVVNTLVSMYGKCGSVADAQSVFDVLSHRDLVTWNAMLAAHVEQDHPEKALQMYQQLLQEGESPNAWTFVSVLQAYGMLAEGLKQMDQLDIENFAGKGKVMHSYVQTKGYHSDVFISNALVSMYGKCGSIGDATNVFDRFSQPDVVAWNAMLAAYVEQGQAEEALRVYEQMQEKGMSQDAWTFVGALQACGMLAEKEEGNGHPVKVKSLQEGRALHEAAQRKGYDLDMFVSTTLISMYGKCGSIDDAQIVFYGLSHRAVASWNAMLAAYAQQGLGEDALQLWRQMQERGVVADEITVLCILQACSSTGSLAIVRHIHSSFMSTRDDWSPLVASALISAYGRCASMEDARTVFDALPKSHAGSWNALIAGYAREGNDVASLHCYEEMQLAGMKPNKVTFLSLLSICSHAGLVDKGVEYFESMKRNFGIEPQIEHYASMADMFGRAGCFTRLEELLTTMPVQPNLPMWLCLLAACQKHGMVQHGKHAFDSAVRLQPKDAAAYVLMANIYADAGLWDHAKEIDACRQKEGARKKPGQSWIELEHGVHNFVVGDDKHLQQAQVYNLLRKVDATTSILQTKAVV